jgi:hypothetical protein
VNRYERLEATDDNIRRAEDNMKRLEDVLKILESIANSFDKESVQYKAIEEAARAFLFVNMDKNLKEEFDRIESDKELSESQKQHLREIGIEP